MKLNAKQRLILSARESEENMVFKTPDRRTETFTSVTRHGQDGAGNYVYSGKYKGGWPSVFILGRNDKMVASSINDKSCNTLADAQKKADYAVAKKLTSYWDSNNPMERYHLRNTETPVLVPQY